MFIVVEGIDKVGKTTLIENLKCKFKEHQPNTKLVVYRFPDRTTSTGKIISDYLEKKIELSNIDIFTLFAKNRLEKYDEMLNFITNGYIVICDRYIYSGIVYAICNGLDQKICLQIESKYLEPDLILHIDAPYEKLLSRYDEVKTEKYETKEFQTNVRNIYNKMYEYSRVEILDALLPKDELTDLAYKKICTEQFILKKIYKNDLLKRYNQHNIE